MKLSCTPVSFAISLKDGQLDLRGFIDFCAEQGFDAVDLLDTQRYSWLWDGVHGGMAEAVRLVEAAGLSIGAYGCGNNFAKTDPDERAAQVEAVKQAIHEAAEAGASVLRIFGGHLAHGRGDAGIESHNGMELVIRGIEQCLPVAEASGVVLALENHGALPGHAFEIEAVIRRFASPFVKCTFDCGNFLGNSMMEVEDPLRSLDCLLDDVAYVHIKDFMLCVEPGEARKVKGVVPGEGIVPLRQLTAMLEKSGYQGFYSLEYEGGAPERENVQKSYAYMNQLRLLHRALGLAPNRAETADR